MDVFSEDEPVRDNGMVYVPQSVITGGEEQRTTTTGGEQRGTSITGVHGTRAPRHAGAVRVEMEAAATPPRPSGQAAATSSPAATWAINMVVTPSRPLPATPCGPTALVGGSDLPRPGMHGLATPMQMSTPIKSTSINISNSPVSPMQDKVNVALKMQVLISSFHNSSQRSMFDKQGMCTQGVRMEKNKIFSKDQIVDFGGIKEEALRGVRSSGRLRA
jgi:hypothetical protein